MFHNLQRLLDKAITETNAQYDPQDIISRLDVRLLTVCTFFSYYYMQFHLILNILIKYILIILKSSPNDVGWDVFSLDYTMDGPLKTVCFLNYLQMKYNLKLVTKLECYFEIINNEIYKKVFTTDSLTRYLRIFNFLWRVKRMEYTICATWRFQKSNMEKFRGINGKPILEFKISFFVFYFIIL